MKSRVLNRGDSTGGTPTRSVAKPQLRIAVLLESSRAFGRGVLDGLGECLRDRRHWLVYYQEGGLGELLPRWLNAWQGDGVIARIENKRMARALAQMKIPVVDILGVHAIAGVPVVKTDHAEIARLAAQHLVERGFRSFAFCGFEGAIYSEQRREAFVQFIQHAGFPCRVFDAGEPPLIAIRQQEGYGWAHERNLIEWLRQLPKPIGVMACNDVRGHQLLNAARQIDAIVPDEIAVVGVDNYETICELTIPPLSSVAQNTRRIASEAVNLLENMLNGHRPPTAPIVIKPCKLVARRSTDAMAVPDPNLKQAVRCIREKATQGIRVAEVARTAGLSRRELERRFLSAFGHSPGREILNVQIHVVKSLLTETDWPLYRIAEKAGFAHAEYLNVAFKRRTGLTPRGYRVQMGRMA